MERGLRRVFFKKTARVDFNLQPFRTQCKKLLNKCIFYVKRK